MNTWFLLMLAGLIAGMMNSAAGGGSFVTFPAMIYAGLPPIVANASSTVAVLPGVLVSSYGYKEYRKPFPAISWTAMVVLTLVGGCIGALLLLKFSSSVFDALVPWLLLISSLTFAFGKQLGNLLRQRVNIGPSVVLTGQFILGIYAGYFGGAVGIMMTAVWQIFGLTDIKIVTANKTYLVFIANAAAVVLFIASKNVDWPPTLAMMLTTILGGYIGTRYAKKLDPAKLRLGIVIFNFIITAVFFYRTFA